MAAKASIKPSDQRKLHTKSGNRCAMCQIILVEEGNPNAACIGENAHIYGEKLGAARYDSSRPDDYVNSEENLIFLCCNCHKKIDTNVGTFSASSLFELKSKHEAWVVQSLERQSANYTFAELEVLANYLAGNNGTSTLPSDYSLLKIEDKMKKNCLTDVQKYINMGLSSVMIIDDYINRNPDPNFDIRLTSAMSNKYQDLKLQSVEPVDIFYILWDFACGGHSEFNFKAAGLGILVYFFEKCEVFEK